MDYCAYIKVLALMAIFDIVKLFLYLDGDEFEATKLHAQKGKTADQR